MNLGPFSFRSVTLYDFEYSAPKGEPPSPICMVAHDLVSGVTYRVWLDELQNMKAPPFPIDRDSLTVSFYSLAELNCHIALGWPLPENILDLCIEQKCLTNGIRPKGVGSSLLDTLNYYGLDAIGAAEKDSMRQLALRGGPWTAEEKVALLTYCESDVTALQKLLPQMIPLLDMPRALFRGRCQRAMAVIESRGAPLNADALARLTKSWDKIQSKLIEKIDTGYNVYEGRTFKAERFEKFLVANGIPWPCTAHGRLQLDQDTFREMANTHPILWPLQQLRAALGQMRLASLAIGRDGRNRCSLWTFSSKTSRNQPGNSEFIFGPSVWLRFLIRPNVGRAVAYVDYEQQEFGIAAALSRDLNMMHAYRSGDAYLAFARLAGAIDGEYDSSRHGSVREQFKQCSLGVQYGMGQDTLALRINQPTAKARALLQIHREKFPVFWEWSDAVVDHAMLHGFLHTVFGWKIQAGAGARPTSLRNFPMQANGAEMLRLACVRLVELGVNVCATVHDAILIDEKIEDIEAAVALTKIEMARASRDILDGFELRTDAKNFSYPDHYVDKRGTEMWGNAWSVLEEIEREEATHPCSTPPRDGAHLPTQERVPGPYINKSLSGGT